MGSLESPGRVWWKPLGRDEKLWVTVALIWSIVMFVMMTAWPAFGQQNTPVESYRVDREEFWSAAQDFIDRYQAGVENDIPVVRPPAGADVYLVTKRYQFLPILELERGKTYRLLVSSLDYQHGLSIQPVNMNFQVLPGYVYVITITPTSTGEFALVCNEYCGDGHHLMTGKIVVREPKEG